MPGEDEPRTVNGFHPGLVKKVIYRPWIRNGREIFGGGNELELRIKMHVSVYIRILYDICIT